VGRDDLDIVADYIYQVISFPMLSSGHLIPSMEEFRCCLRIDESR